MFTYLYCLELCLTNTLSHPRNLMQIMILRQTRTVHTVHASLHPMTLSIHYVMYKYVRSLSLNTSWPFFFFVGPLIFGICLCWYVGSRQIVSCCITGPDDGPPLTWPAPHWGGSVMAISWPITQSVFTLDARGTCVCFANTETQSVSGLRAEDKVAIEVTWEV